MLRLKIGDVIRKGETYRVVRDLKRYDDGRLWCITCTIKRCSWTKRCYTVLGFPELYSYQPVGVRIKLNKPIDRLIWKAIHDKAEHRPYTLTCEDVLGIA